MSNCIELHQHVVTIPKDRFDVDSFEKLREKYKNGSKTPDSSVGFDEYIYCWFLRDNSRVDENGNLVIEFGKGNSTHTWRDFRQTLWLLNPFFKLPVVHIFMVADEMDGFDSIGPLTVHFPYKTWEDLAAEV